MAARAKTAAHPARQHPPFRGYPPAALTWLRGIAEHNDRAWFAEHRAAFDADVLGPTVALAGRLGARMASFLPDHVPAEPADAVLRIHRDLRFTEDKTPYKTEIALWFPYRGRSTRDCAAVRIGVSARGVTVVGGAYAPGGPALWALRDWIAEYHADLTRILRRKSLRETMGDLQGALMLRIPSAYGQDHPAGELLMRKQLYLETCLPAKLATTPDLEKELLRRMKAMAPFLQALNEGIDGV